MTYVCCQERRLQVIKLAGTVNGIEDLEVARVGPPQRTLLVRLLRPAGGINTEQVKISGGQRIKDIHVRWVAAADALPAGEDPALVADLDEPDHVLVVRTNAAGDYSPYTLHIDAAPADFDPVLADIEFSFKIDCEAKLDCRDSYECPPPTAAVPQIDYLAKDYASLRRTLLDRMSLIAPDWRERSPADLGVMLVEILAYEGDRLSYRQDAIATEAYLESARSRVSLRRHARLVDYPVHDGCSARVLLRCTTSADSATLPASTKVYSKIDGLPGSLTAVQEKIAVDAGATVFETVETNTLYADHNLFSFYTWGDDDCCVPKGSTSATLRGAHPDLRAGDLLIFAEIVSPTTGEAADRDPAHVWAVRLTQVGDAEDPCGGKFDDPSTNNAVNVTEITWDAADRLPFSLCLSAPAAAGQPVSVAWGNIVVADHGRTVDSPEPLGTVAPAHLFYPPDSTHCAPRSEPRALPTRYRPHLSRGPLTRSVNVGAPELDRTKPIAAVIDSLTNGKPEELSDWLFGYGVQFSYPPVFRGSGSDWSVSDGDTVLRIQIDSDGKLLLLGRPIPACAVTAAAPRDAHPSIRLDDGTATWRQERDLLGSGPADRLFVVETEHDGTVFLRLNEPKDGTEFTAVYRVGNGNAGNVGANTLVHIADTGVVNTVSNPLPAGGGAEPETADEIRRDAPQAYRVQQRAVTPSDWQEVAGRSPRVQRAAATWRWTGSWHTVFLTVDPAGGTDVDVAFERDLRRDLEKFRLAGYDLEIDRPHYVPLEISMHVCVANAHQRSEVRGEVLAAVGRLFDPDNLTFAQPVYLSAIYAAVHGVPGIASVTVKTFRRQQDTPISGLDSGVLTMGRLEIARLDNNPNFPENGVLELTLGGGK
ncbi:putative baseplate assembly protein [Mycobacterium sp. C3-094]